jgi:hypothetical protein
MRSLKIERIMNLVSVSKTLKELVSELADMDNEL